MNLAILDYSVLQLIVLEGLTNNITTTVYHIYLFIPCIDICTLKIKYVILNDTQCIPKIIYNRIK